jgi:hypothetical protein
MQDELLALFPSDLLPSCHFDRISQLPQNIGYLIALLTLRLDDAVFDRPSYATFPF